MPASAFLGAVDAASSGLSDEDLAQAVLEALAVPGSGVTSEDPQAMFKMLFSHLDVSGQVGGSSAMTCMILALSPLCKA